MRHWHPVIAHIGVSQGVCISPKPCEVDTAANDTAAANERLMALDKALCIAYDSDFTKEINEALWNLLDKVGDLVIERGIKRTECVDCQTPYAFEECTGHCPNESCGMYYLCCTPVAPETVIDRDTVEDMVEMFAP